MGISKNKSSLVTCSYVMSSSSVPMLPRLFEAAREVNKWRWSRDSDVYSLAYNMYSDCMPYVRLLLFDWTRARAHWFDWLKSRTWNDDTFHLVMLSYAQQHRM